jgi:hypothetical protein
MRLCVSGDVDTIRASKECEATTQHKSVLEEGEEHFQSLYKFENENSTNTFRVVEPRTVTLTDALD